jgi:hypothetical protein
VELLGERSSLVGGLDDHPLVADAAQRLALTSLLTSR